MNAGELPTPTTSKRKGRREKSEVNATATPTASTAPVAEQGGGSQRGGRGRGRSGSTRGRGGRSGRGGKGGEASGETPEKPDVTCLRCAKKGHELAGCWASNHLDGHKLTCPKPAPIPEKFKKSVTSVSALRRLDPYFSDGDIPDDRSEGGDYYEEEAFTPFAYVNTLTISAVERRIVDEVEEPPMLVDSSCSESESSPEEDPEVIEVDPEVAFQQEIRDATARFHRFYSQNHGAQSQLAFGSLPDLNGNDGMPPLEDTATGYLSFTDAYLHGPFTPESPVTRTPGSLVCPIEESKSQASLVMPILGATTRQ